jgi:hypothetical protein
VTNTGARKVTFSLVLPFGRKTDPHEEHKSAPVGEHKENCLRRTCPPKRFFLVEETVIDIDAVNDLLHVRVDVVEPIAFAGLILTPP